MMLSTPEATDVVHEERRRDDDSGNLAEVRAGDLVVAAAGRIGADELTIAEHDDDEQDDDERGDERGESEKREAAGQQDHHELLRRIRHRAERVRREDGQSAALREELLGTLVGGDRLAQKKPFDGGCLFGTLSNVVRHVW
jgi:hypothetical protein